VKKTVACCKIVLKDYWQSLRIDSTDKSEVWIEEAKRKQLVKFILLWFMLIEDVFFFRALSKLANNQTRPPQYDLTPTLVINRTEEQSKKIEQDIKRALEFSPHQKPLERG